MSHFETKEQYQKFISGWKSATNADECKSKRVVCDHVQYYGKYPGYTKEEQARFEDKGYTRIRSYSYTIPNGGHRKEEGWLTAEHHIMYNLLRGKDPMRGFNPRSARKRQEHESPYYNYITAIFRLETIVKEAQNSGVGQAWSVAALEEFLKPFDGKITVQDLASIDVEGLAKARRFHH